MNHFNVIGENFNALTDLSLFYTDEEISKGYDIPLTKIEDSDISLAHLLARLGKFQSVGEAKKNGWLKPIPSGWNYFKIGKGKNRFDIWLWNPESKV